MDFVPIELAGRTYKLRYTASDIQEICRRLTTFEPVGAGKVMPSGPNGLGTKILNLDVDTFQFCLWAGMRHIAEYKDVDPADAARIISAHIERGGQWTDFRRPFLKTLIACGFADFTPVMKILDDTERQAAQDSAIEIQANRVEDGLGNGLTPFSSSATTSSMRRSRPDDSDSLTSIPGSEARDL
jgi:hypothetical protein